jgi:ligand-binding SRPBCC domain-containing protein
VGASNELIAVNRISEIRREQWVPCALEEVFEFFSSARNLEALTPSWLNFQIMSAPEQLEQGARIEYRLVWHAIGLRWSTIIAKWDPPHAFVDVQLSGPYRLWEHTHSFVAERGGTRLFDTVRYELPLGVLGRIAHSIRVRSDLKKIFDYRAQVIEQQFSRQSVT